MKRYEKIVVRMPNWVGDVVMATPALRSIRRHWPEAELTAMCLPSGAKILAGNPHVDRIETYGRNGRDGGLFGRGRMIRRLRRHGHDLGILLPNSFSSAWIFWRAKIPERVGTAYARPNFLVTERFEPAMEDGRRVPRAMPEHYADLLETLGVPRGETKPELFETEEGRAEADETLAALGVRRGDPILAVNPGASFGPSKLWFADRYAEVADRLQEKYGLKPVLLGSPSEEHLLDEIERKMKTRAYSTANEPLDLDALKTVIRRSSLMIATDAGPRHYAVAFDVPIVVLMGPTDPRYSEAHAEKSEVLRVELDCSPCHQKTCPLTHHRCMDWVETKSVLEAAERLLERYPPPEPPPPEPEDDEEESEGDDEDGPDESAGEAPPPGEPFGPERDVFGL